MNYLNRIVVLFLSSNVKWIVMSNAIPPVKLKTTIVARVVSKANHLGSTPPTPASNGTELIGMTSRHAAGTHSESHKTTALSETYTYPQKYDYLLTNSTNSVPNSTRSVNNNNNSSGETGYAEHVFREGRGWGGGGGGRGTLQGNVSTKAVRNYNNVSSLNEDLKGNQL